MPRTSPSPAVVRPATAADLDAVLALRLALLREHANNPVYGRLRQDAPERARRLFAAQLAARGEVTFLAVRLARAGAGRGNPREEAVGILRCIESHGSPLLDPARYGYVASAYVTPTARRGGVLRRLLDAAVEWCAARDLDELRLHSASDNPSANAVWETLGFRVAEHLRVRALRPDG